MTVQYQYDKKSNVIHVHPGECITLNSMTEYFNDILSDKNIRQGFIEVVSFDEVNEFNYSSNDAFSVKNLIEKVKSQKQNKGAVIVAKTDLQYGMARMLGTILDDYFPVAIVRSEDEIVSNVFKLDGKQALSS